MCVCVRVCMRVCVCACVLATQQSTRWKRCIVNTTLYEQSIKRGLWLSEILLESYLPIAVDASSNQTLQWLGVTAWTWTLRRKTGHTWNRSMEPYKLHFNPSSNRSHRPPLWEGASGFWRSRPWANQRPLHPGSSSPPPSSCAGLLAIPGGQARACPKNWDQSPEINSITFNHIQSHSTTFNHIQPHSTTSQPFNFWPSFPQNLTRSRSSRGFNLPVS